MILCARQTPILPRPVASFSSQTSSTKTRWANHRSPGGLESRRRISILLSHLWQSGPMHSYQLNRQMSCQACQAQRRYFFTTLINTPISAGESSAPKGTERPGPPVQAWPNVTIADLKRA